MHYRLVINSEDRFSGSVYNFEHMVNTYPLNEFAGKHVHFGLEWITPIQASNTDSEFGASPLSPYAIGLQCPSITQFNTRESWRGSCSSIIALLPGYLQSGNYGMTNDTPYLDHGHLAGVMTGDDLANKGLLKFNLVAFPSENSAAVINGWEPAYMNEFAFSLVFWTVDVPRSPEFDHFHLWLSTSDRSSGTTQSCRIPVDLTTWSMHEGEWNVAVSYISPVVANDTTETGLMLVSNTLSQGTHANRNILAMLPANAAPGESTTFGRRLGVKPIHNDTLGCHINTPVDHLGEIELDIVELSMNSPPGAVSDFVLCLTFYRVG